MVERTFLNAMVSFLTANLSPTPVTLGIAEPAGVGDLPAVVLSLSGLKRQPSGLGERSQLITDGALPWSATIELDKPVLPEEPTFSLLSPDRRELVLPHGGLVRADGSAGPLDAGSFSVTVAGQGRTLVTGVPGPDEVNCDPLVGRLVFGAPLPATGKVVVNYILGQWEQRVARLEGTLRIRVVAATAAAAATLSDSVIGELADGGQAGLERIVLTELESIGPPDTALNNARSRTMAFEFEYEAVINRPDSSGGIIQRIPLTALLGRGA
ncbi:MAG TPA: hypothetical protein VMS96_05545 [Terriglobales bacterium]|nr:hypothetical protein [Terriglobales bacterium]